MLRLTPFFLFASWLTASVSLSAAEDAPFPEFSSPLEIDRTVRFPPDAGVIDVTAPPYSARGDGRTDDTAAIQQAIRDALNFRSGSRIVYFPAGTYLIRDTLSWQDENGKWFNYVSLQGESRKKSILKLANGADGFDNPDQPKAMIRTGSLGRWGKNGNAAFSNYIADLTFSTGSNNPGAIGIDYLGNNDTALRNLRIGSEDRQGVAGFASIRNNGGPYLAKNIEIVGFDYGVMIGYSWYAHVFEYLVLRDQKIAGIRVLPPDGLNPQGPLLTLRRVTHLAPVPLLQQEDPSSLVSMIEVYCGAPIPDGESVLQGEGFYYLRDLWTEALPSEEDSRAHTPLLLSHESERFPADPEFTLPIEETPFLDPGPPENWVPVTRFGADPRDQVDDAPAIQRALDSGAAVIYFPIGEKTNDYYRIESSLRIPSTVTHLIGMNMRIKPPKNHPEFYSDSPAPVFIIAEPSETPLTLERMKIDEFWHFGKIESIHHEADRPLILRELIMENYWAGPQAGPLFIESLACARITLPPSNRTWARHLNPETIGDKVLNNGGDFWVLGLKSEQASTLVRTTSGGRSEILGALQTASPPIPDDVPIFVLEDGCLAFSLITVTNSDRQKFETLVEVESGENVMRVDGQGRSYKTQYDVVIPRAGIDTRQTSRKSSLVYWDSRSDAPVLLRSGSTDEPLSVTLSTAPVDPNQNGPAVPPEEPSFFDKILSFFSNKPTPTESTVVFPEGENRIALDLAADGEQVTSVTVRDEDLRGWPHTLVLPPVQNGEKVVPDDSELVLALQATRGLKLDSDLGAREWTDQSEFENRVDSVTSARRPTLTKVNGQPALSFADDKLEIHVSEQIHGQTLLGRTWILRLEADTDRPQRQTVYHEGAGRRGVILYVQDGKIQFSGWNLAKDGLNTPWEGAHLSAPLHQEGFSTVAIILDAIEPSLTLYIDGEPVDQTAEAGVFGRHTGGRSFLGVRHMNASFPGEPAPKLTPVEGRGGDPFFGSITDVLVFNRALPAAEVQVLSKYLANP